MLSIINYNLEHKRKFFKVFLLFLMLIVANIGTMAQPSNLIVTLPQILCVLYCILKRDLRSAILWHMSFIMLSLSAQGTLGMFSTNFAMYNYGTIKLVGPLRVSYAISIILALYCNSKGLAIRKDISFYKLFKVMLYLGGSASVIGGLGLLLNSYYSVQGFIDNAVYMFSVLVNMYILLCFSDERMFQQSYYISLGAISAGVLGSYIGYRFLGIVSHYSVYDIAYLADVVAFTPMLLIAVVFIKERLLLWITIIVYFILTLEVAGGKTFFALLFAFICLAYFMFFDSRRLQISRTQLYVLRLLVGVGCLILPTLIIANVSDDSMVFYKFMSAKSIFSGDISNMSRSPYIRFASLYNILHEGLSNPLTLLFGNGYGGYFQDGLGLFNGIDLSNGAWGDECIRTGRFTSGHDMMVTVPLFNGLIGVYLIGKIAILYFKRMKFNYLSSAVFFWILLKFYFNTIVAVIGLFLLFASEYKNEKK